MPATRLHACSCFIHKHKWILWFRFTLTSDNTKSITKQMMVTHFYRNTKTHHNCAYCENVKCFCVFFFLYLKQLSHIATVEKIAFYIDIPKILRIKNKTKKRRNAKKKCRKISEFIRKKINKNGSNSVYRRWCFKCSNYWCGIKSNVEAKYQWTCDRWCVEWWVCVCIYFGKF